MNSVLHINEPTTGCTTPILDSGVIPPRRRAGTAKVLSTGLIIGVVLMEALALFGEMWNEHGPAIFILLLILAIAIHELGHLIAGWAVGFSFSSLQVGPLFLENQYGVLRAQLSTDMMALGLAGMFADNVRKLRRRLLIYIVGGPAANLATVIIVIIVSRLVPSTPVSGVATAVGQLAAISLVLAMLSLVPITSTDGASIEMLISSPFAARRFLSTMALGSQYNRGLRPRNWKQTWLRAATYIPDKSRSDFYASWMAYLAANDRKDVDLAAQYLERCLETTPALTLRWRDLVAQEAAVFSAWFAMDGDLAEKWLTQVKKRRSLMPILRVRIEVALDCGHRDYDKALAAWDKGFSLVQKLPTTPSNKSLMESWLEWRTEILERPPQFVSV